MGMQKKGGDDNTETKKYGSLEISSVKTPSLASALANLPGLNDSWKTKFLSNYKNSIDSGKPGSKVSKGKGDVVTLDESEDSTQEAADNSDIVIPSQANASDDIAADDDMSMDSNAMLDDTDNQPTDDIGEQENTENGDDLPLEGNDSTSIDTESGTTEGMNLPLDD